jgi:hypothetical protein
LREERGVCSKSAAGSGGGDGANVARRTWRLSTEKATLSTSLVWPTKRRVVAPVVRSHRRSVPSHEPESANWPSLEITTSCTKCEWPVSARLAWP